MPQFPSAFLQWLLLFALTMLCNSESISQVSEYSSKADGAFDNPNNWTLTSQGNEATQLGCSLADNERIIVAHQIEASCEGLEVYGKGDVTILSGASLIIPGDLELFGEAEIKVEKGAMLQVSGNVWLSGNANISVDGELFIHGNVDVAGDAEACGDGEASVAGSISGQKWCYDIRLLPMPLLEIKTEFRSDQGIEIYWDSRLTQRTGFYVISRSYNGMSYDIISKIKLGASEQIESYRFTDYPALDRTVYYRVTEYDGSANMRASQLTSVDIRNNDENLCHLEVFPNPCIPSCIAKLVDCPEGNFTTQILDASGNIISDLLPAPDGSGHIQYHINKDNFLSPGVYIINSTNDQSRLSKKVIVK